MILISIYLLLGVAIGVAAKLLDSSDTMTWPETVVSSALFGVPILINVLIFND